MAEVLAEFEDVLVDENGVSYRAQAVGAPAADGLWQGWIEFVPVGGGTSLRTPRETTQPKRADALYWGAGLSSAYLEGAFDRARRPVVQRRTAPSKPVFDEPAPAVVRTVDVPAAEAVLDPFSVYEKGEGLLRQELGALQAWHLVNIILAYRLSGDPVSTLNDLSAHSLIEIIVAGVREQSFLRE